MTTRMIAAGTAARTGYLRSTSTIRVGSRKLGDDHPGNTVTALRRQPAVGGAHRHRPVACRCPTTGTASRSRSVDRRCSCVGSINVGTGRSPVVSMPLRPGWATMTTLCPFAARTASVTAVASQPVASENDSTTAAGRVGRRRADRIGRVAPRRGVLVPSKAAPILVDPIRHRQLRRGKESVGDQHDIGAFVVAVDRRPLPPDQSRHDHDDRDRSWLVSRGALGPNFVQDSPVREGSRRAMVGTRGRPVCDAMALARRRDRRTVRSWPC